MCVCDVVICDVVHCKAMLYINITIYYIYVAGFVKGEGSGGEMVTTW